MAEKCSELSLNPSQCQPETLVKMLLSRWLEVMSDSLSALEETGLDLEQDERRACEEIHTVWYEMKECVNKVALFLNHDKNLKKCTNSASVQTPVYIESVTKLYTKLENACKHASAVAGTFSTRTSASDIFAQPIKVCEKLKKEVKRKRQSRKVNGCMLILAVITAAFACGFKLCGAMGIKDVVIAGIVVGIAQLIASGVVVYTTYVYHCKCQIFEEMCAKLLESLKLAQETTSGLSYTFRTMNLCLSDMLAAVSDMLPAVSDKLKNNKTASEVSAVPSPKVLASQPQQQPNTNSSNNILWRFWGWCRSHAPWPRGDNKTTPVAQRAKADRVNKISVDQDFIKKFKETNESFNMLSEKLSDCS